MHNSNGNTFSFISHISYYSYYLWIAACFQILEFNNTSLYQNDGEQTQPQEHQHSCPILLEYCHSSPNFCKSYKKLQSVRKFKHARNSNWPRTLYFPCTNSQNNQFLVYQLGTGQNILFGGFTFKFAVQTIMYHYYHIPVKSFKQGCNFTICSRVGWNTFIYSLHNLYF